MRIENVCRKILLLLQDVTLPCIKGLLATMINMNVSIKMYRGLWEYLVGRDVLKRPESVVNSAVPT